MQHVVMFSGGAGSWAAAKRVAERHGTERLTLLFADTQVEDCDTYRFARDAAANVGAPLVTVADGRTPFDVFRDNRFLGNSRLANCSKFLKQAPCRDWLMANATPADAVLYVGIDWTETSRILGIVAGWAPYRVEFPMAEAPYIDKNAMLAWMRREGLEPPAGYAEGFPHNNCLEQGCVRGGQAYWARLLRSRRSVYLATEAKEAGLRDYLGADVTILKDRTGGTARPLTLRALRESIEAGGQLDLFEWGGCGCFTDSDTDSPEEAA